MGKSTRIWCLVIVAIGAFPILATVLGRDQREVKSFQKLTLNADDIAEMTGVNVHKFQVDQKKDQRFSIVLREQENANAVPRELNRFEFTKENKDQTTIRVGFIGVDRKLTGFLLSNEKEAEFRVGCSGC